MAGLLKQAAEQVRKAGAKGSPDKILAHITPEEARLLKARGGSGRIDPKTGLPHFDYGGNTNEGGSDVGSDTPDPGEGSIDDGSGGSDSGPEDSSWGGGLSGALGMGVSGLNEEDEGKDGSQRGRSDDPLSDNSRDEENGRNNYNQALGDAYRGSVEDARAGGRGDANFANTDLSEARAGEYAAALQAAGLTATEAARGGIGGRGEANFTDEGATFGNGFWGGTGDRNAALDRGGYGFGERASEFGVLNAALNYGAKSGAALSAAQLGLSIANPLASLAVNAADMGGKAAFGGDVTMGDIGGIGAGYAGLKGGVLAGTAAKTANDTINKGMDLTQSIAQSLYGVLGGMTGGMAGRGIGDALDGDKGQAVGQAIGGTVGAIASQGMAQNASRGAGADQGGAQGNASDSVSSGTTLAAQLGLLNGVNPNRSTIKLK